ncbi:hypothetical protein ACPUER_36245, partial [Burkholderia sp. DN3021]|uniref:hypothetical protein n=1 Tax=Burkholderia sp. DN3021 TaxID=3410137 RepID=UPI003C7E5685
RSCCPIAGRQPTLDHLGDRSRQDDFAGGLPSDRTYPVVSIMRIGTKSSELHSEVWGANSSTRQDLTAAFASLYDRGVKIARVSKWFCFLNQRRFAIYDSRVSVALRDCRDDQGKRVSNCAASGTEGR